MPATCPAPKSSAVRAGTLYVVATPLGNLGDVTVRCGEVLSTVDAVLAEDTRRARILLQHLGVQRQLTSLHAHNERQRTNEVVEELLAGRSLALLTDAGTPAISDPGAFLVQAAHAAGVPVCPLPGASALSCALSAAGFAHEVAQALFVGFVPRSGKERRASLKQLHAFLGVVVLFESPHRVAATLAELAEAEPEREACVCRELTKQYEEIRRAPLRELAAWSTAHTMRGEFTLVLGPKPVAPAASADGEDEAAGAALGLDEALRACMAAGLHTRDAAAAVAAIYGRPRRALYRRALELGAAPGA